MRLTLPTFLSSLFTLLFISSLEYRTTLSSGLRLIRDLSPNTSKLGQVRSGGERGKEGRERGREGGRKLERREREGRERGS